MTVLTDLDKRIIIKLTGDKYSETHRLHKNAASDELLSKLTNKDINPQTKWAEIETFLKNPKNAKSRMGKILDKFIQYAQNQKINPDEIQIGNYNENSFNYFNDVFKQELIDQILLADIKKDVEKNWIKDYALKLKIMNEEGRSLQDKWNAIIEFCKDKSNHTTLLYVTLQNIVLQHDINSDHLHHARKQLEKAGSCRESDQKSSQTHYNSALQFLEKITVKTPEIYALMGNCQLNLGHLKNAYFSFKQACKTTDKKLLQPCTQQRNFILDKLLKSGNYISDNFTKRHDKTSYHFSIFRQTVSQSIDLGLIPASRLLQFADGGLPIALPLVLLGISVGILGAFSGVLGGSVCGFFNSVTRHPLNLQKQETLLKNIETMAHATTEDKKELIEKIISHYSSTKKCSSKASETLLKCLQDSSKDVAEKWQSLQYYLLDRDGDNYLKNAGKKLFCIISEAIDAHLVTVSNTPN